MWIRSLGSLIRSSFCIGLVCLSFSACKSSDEDPLVKKGRAVYQSACIACHNSDPKQDGALGPSVAGSSQELLQARIVGAKYPDGYTPKRTTHLMVALPQYESDIPALHAYLNSLK